MTIQASLPSPHDASVWGSQFRMTHTFHLSLGSNEPIAGRLESTLKNAQVRVDKWVIARRGGFYDHCITVEGIGEESARELRKEFAGLASGIKVHVEHLLHFDSGTARR